MNITLSQLDAGDSIHSIASTTSVSTETISMLNSNKHSDLKKSTGDCQTKLSSTIVCYAIYFISAHKAETAVEVTKTLSNITKQPLHPWTTHQYLKKAGMKAVIKSKHSLLSVEYCKAHLDFAYTHND